jgi:hypothetical protein
MLVIYVGIIVIIYLYMISILKDQPIVEGLNTFVGRLAIDDQYFYDKLFDDVYYYPNEPNGMTGWDRCRTECIGNCVEYGISGNSYCFPPL